MKMVRWLSATAGTAIVAATFALPAGAAFAATPGSGNITGVGNVSAGSGNTINAPISAPVNLCSISLGLLGFANSSCLGGGTTDVTISPSGGNGNTTGVGNLSALAGNTINAPVSLPLNVCAVSVAAGGFANSSCKGGAAVNPPACHDRHCAPKPPACTGSHCAPPRHGTKPSTTPAGTNVASVTTPSSGLLPTTGADMLDLAAGATALIGLGTGTVVLSRRRRNDA